MDNPSALANRDLIEPVEVHQAAGMLTARLGISITDAISRLREHGAAAHRPLIDISRDIIARRLQLPIPDESD